MWDWSSRRHPGKSASWIKRKYFRSQGLRNWIFFAKAAKDNGTDEYTDLFKAGSVAIKRHIKIKAEATPYDPRFTEYFSKRELRSTGGGLKQQQATKIKSAPNDT